MKNRILFLLVVSLAGFWGACSDDDDNKKALEVAFERTSYVLPEESPVDVSIHTSKPVEQDVLVKLKVEGTAVLNEDYTISSEEVLIPSGTGSAKITITPKENFTNEKDIRLSILSSADYRIGKNGTATVAVTAKEQVIYSFDREYYGLTDEVSLRLEIAGRTLPGYTSSVPFEFLLEVSSSSTAEEGVHFRFADGEKKIVVPAGQKSGSVKIELLSREEGKDVIILEVKNSNPRFIAGAYDKAIVNVYGEMIGLMLGKWVFKEERALEFWKIEFPTMPSSDFVNMPINNTNLDTLEFIAGEEPEMIVKVAGDMKNYFRNCTLKYLRTEVERLQEEGYPPPRVEMPVFELSKANVKFSENQIEERPVIAGFRIIDANTLEVSVYDYEPVDFFQEIYALMAEFATPEMPAMRHTQIRYHFTKVE